MKSSNNNTHIQHQKIGIELAGLSGKRYNSAVLSRAKNSQSRRLGVLNPQPLQKNSPQQEKSTPLDKHSVSSDKDSSRYCIQTYSQRQKSVRRLFKIQEQVLNKDIHKTVRYCRRIQSFHSKEITAQEGKKGGNISGVFLCGSSHCPACFGRIAQEKRNQLKKVIGHSKDKGMRIAMMTLTFSHQYGNDLKKILESLSIAKTYFMRQRKFKKIDIQWHISRLEFTYSENNGFHPHYHIAMGINDNIDEHELKQEWMRVCEKYGLSCSYDKGLDLVIDEKFEGVEKYIMKDGKTDISFEVASDGIKQARNENVSMEYLMDVLAGFEKENIITKDRARNILYVYYANVKGKAIFSVSNKFKDIVEEIDTAEKDEEKQDDQIERQQPGAPSLKIGRWILHYLAYTNNLNYLYDFIGHNDLTKLYDDLLYILPEKLINGVVWIEPAEEIPIAA